MPKSISIYIPDHLAEQMETFSEVNWSEISRISIEDYINGRRRYENLGKIIEGYFEDIDKLKGKLERLIKYEQDVREGYTSQTMFTSGGDKIICSVTSLIYYIEKSELELTIALENDLDWDVVLDRITYKLTIIEENRILIKKDGSYLTKEILGSNEIGFGAKSLIPLNSNEVKIFEEISKKDENERAQNIYYTIEMQIFCDSRKGVIRKWDIKSDELKICEKRHF